MAQPAPSTAPPPRPFDSEFVLDLPSVGSPAIRPGDGAVAYVVSHVDRETLASESHIEQTRRSYIQFSATSTHFQVRASGMP